MAEDRGLILVAGATGYIGGKLALRLLAEGRRVRCLARRPERLRGLVGQGAEAAAGDLRDPGALRRALAGVDAAYYLVHSLGEAGDFREADRACARAFAAAAREAGVRRVVYLGGLGGDAGGSEHLEGRREVGRLLRESGAEVVELRAAVVIGSGSASFELVRALVERLPVLLAPRWVRVKTQPIAVDDLLDYLVAALDAPARGAVIEIGGRDAVSYADLMREYARQRGLRRLIVPVPFLTPRLSSRWLALVTPVYARVGRRLFTSLRSETVVRDAGALEAFPGIHPRGLPEAVAAALADEAGRPRYVDARSVRVAAPASAVLEAAKLLGRPYGSWRLELFEAGRRLRLISQARLPGRGSLDIEVSPEGSGSRLTMTAAFEPRGLGGRLYWRAMRPAHAVIFREMLRRAARRARRLARAKAPAVS
jgi:uncharacterized protein YbjT (DUF2867 family)